MKIKTYIFWTTMVLNLLVAGNNFAQEEWHWQNPLPQGNILYSVNFPSPDTGWAVGGGGTIIKTTDGGKTWIRQKSGTLYDLFSVFFINTNTGYTVGGGGTILKTVDSGNNWNSLTSGITHDLKSVFFLGVDTGFTVGSSKFLKTTDGGITWSIQTVNSEYNNNRVFFVSSNLGFIAGSWWGAPSGKIFKTVNGGTTWTSYSPGGYWMYDVYFIDGNNGFAVGGKSSAVGSAGLICKTTNGGSSWSKIIEAEGEFFRSLYFWNADTGFVIGGNTILKTTDNGNNWSRQMSRTTNNLYGVFCCSSIICNVVGSNGTIIKTIDGGINWISQTKEVTINKLYDIYWISATTGFAVGGVEGWGATKSQGIILKTHNGGSSWDLVLESADIFFKSVFLFNEYIGLVVGSNGTILKTCDGGKIWDSLISGVSGQINCVFFLDKNCGYVVGDNGLILKTIDGGTTWKFQTSGTSFNLHSIFFIDCNIGYIAGASGTILKTTNGGIIWISQLKGTSTYFYFIFFFDSYTGFALGQSGTLIKTTNGGSDWTNQIIQETDDLKSISFLDMNNGYMVSSNSAPFPYMEEYRGRLWRTTNAGTDWSKQASISQGLHSIVFTNTNTGYTVGSNGSILAYSNILPIPNSPTNLTVSDLGNFKSHLNWQDNADNETGYTVYRFNIPIADLPADAVSHTDTLTQSGDYSYKIRAVNNSGVSSFSNWGSVMLNNPLPNQVQLIAPLHLTKIGTDSVLFTWNQSKPEISKYWFEYASDSLFSYPTTDTMMTDTFKVVRQLNNNNSYWWRVKAKNSTGWGSFSEVWIFTVSIVSIENSTRLRSEFKISQNYPNPFNPVTAISYQLSVFSEVELSVYNLLGQKVTTLVSAKQTAGTYKVQWDATGFASGVYFYRLTTDQGFIETRKLVLLR